MTGVCIRAIGLCAPGLTRWEAARPLLAGSHALDVDAQPILAATALPVTERRRANATSRWALAAAHDAVHALAPADIAALPTVFASADGDGEVLAVVLRDLALDRVMLSPTTFHNSVFNAPAGYWSLAAHAPAASTTICAAQASFAAGLVEALTQARLADAPVLLVAYDLPFPADAPIRTTAREPFACALLVDRDRDQAVRPVCRVECSEVTGSPAAVAPADERCARFAGNAAAAALPLLCAIARGAPARVALPWLDGDHVAVAITPCR